jgi:phenylacetate-CoA ligase
MLKKFKVYKFLLKQKKKYSLKKKILRNRNLIESFLDLDKHNFEEIQKKLLYKILIYSKDNIPYYSKILENILIEKNEVFNIIKQVPLLSKNIIREEKDRMFPVDFSSKVHKGWMNTGGSTGEPLLFPTYENMEAIHQYALYNLIGKKNGELIVSVDGSRVNDIDLNNNIYWTYDYTNIIYGETHFSVLYMNVDTLPYYVSHLNFLKPTVIRGYPSGLTKLANFLYENGLKLDFHIKGIYLTSEYYDKIVINNLSTIFSCPIYGQYGHAEASVFAFTQANSLEYFCSPLYGYTEVLNKNNKQADVGELGEVVVTGFYNKCMPFIRYRTGDLAVYGGRKNGYVILKSLQGRTVDYIVNLNHEKVYLIGLIFGGHLKCFENIKTWQIEQNVVGRVDVRIVRDEKFSSIDEDEIKSLLLSVTILSEFHYAEEIKMTDRGKQKFLIQNLQ